MAFFCVLPSSLQSVLYSCPRRTSFLEDVATTRTATTPAYNTTNHDDFLPFSLSGAVSDALTIDYTGLPCNLWLLVFVASGFCAIIATHVLALIMSLNYVGGIPCMPISVQLRQAQLFFQVQN